jgi:hypothetical protein
MGASFADPEKPLEQTAMLLLAPCPMIINHSGEFNDLIA